TPKLVECARSVGQQTPGFGEDTERIDGRDAIASSQRSDVRVMADRKGIRHNDEATIRLARRCGDNTFKRGHIINWCDDRLHAQRGGRRFEGVQVKEANGAMAGLNTIATLATRGAISFSSSTHLPPSEFSIGVNPVRLPPGRDRLATNPLPTGSPTIAKTMGMVFVCCRMAAVAGVLPVRMRSG